MTLIEKLGVEISDFLGQNALVWPGSLRSAWDAARDAEELLKEERELLLQVEVSARKFVRVEGNGQPRQLEDAAMWCQHELKALDGLRSNALGEGRERGILRAASSGEAATSTAGLGFAADEPKHVVGLSGGKDSTALALWLVENEPREYEFICNETGNELPEMQAHWAMLERMLGQPLKRVRHTADLLQLCEDQQALPNFRMRWCTRILKIEPTIAYMEALPAGSVLYVGLRADEEPRRGIFGEDMTIRFPMREQGWAEADVWRYLAKRGVSIPDRTDCALCPYQRLEEWKALWENHPDKWAQGVALEKRIGHTFRSDGRDTWPAAMEALGEEFASGRKLRKSSRGTTCRVCSL